MLSESLFVAICLHVLVECSSVAWEWGYCDSVAWLRGVTEPNIRGVILTRRGRKVGNDAQIMPTVSSKYDHNAASTLSHVESPKSDAVLNVRRRTTDMTQAL